MKISDTFCKWLKAQHKRDDRVGDLARDMVEDSFRGRTFVALREHMDDLGACLLAIISLEIAEMEWLNELNLSELLEYVEDIGVEHYNGHISLFRFTTHWKCMWRTPSLYSEDGAQPTHPDLRAGLLGLVQQHRVGLHVFAGQNAKS